MPFSPTKQNLGIALIAVVAGITAWLMFRPGDAEAAIHKRLDALEELAHKSAPESQFESIGKARRAAGFVTENASLELLPGMGSVDGRDALSGTLVALRNRATHIDLSLGSRQITLADSGDRATVTLTASASGEGFGERRSHRTRYRMEWVKLDGDWYIARTSRLDD